MSFISTSGFSCNFAVVDARVLAITAVAVDDDDDAAAAAVTATGVVALFVSDRLVEPLADGMRFRSLRKKQIQTANIHYYLYYSR